MLDLSIIILSFNTKKLTLDCLSAIGKEKTAKKFDVWVVDNASDDDTVNEIGRKHPNVNIIRNEKNLGFSGGNNVGLKRVFEKSKYCLLLNSDTIIKKGFIDNILDVAESENFSVLSCKLIGKDQKLQPNAGCLPKPLFLAVWLTGIDDLFRRIIRIPSYQERYEGFYKGTKKVGWVSGSVMLINNSILKNVGLLDDKIFMYSEDVDYCWRVWKKDLCVGWTDKCEVVHLGGGSLKEAKRSQWLGEFKGLIYLYKKHYGEFASKLLKIKIQAFVFIRIIIFSLFGRKEKAKTYGKIIKEI